MTTTPKPTGMLDISGAEIEENQTVLVFNKTSECPLARGKVRWNEDIDAYEVVFDWTANVWRGMESVALLGHFAYEKLEDENEYDIQI